MCFRSPRHPHSEGKKFSQGDLEKRTELLRCYVSRVENGHTIPSVETLEKISRALDSVVFLLRSDVMVTHEKTA